MVAGGTVPHMCVRANGLAGSGEARDSLVRGGCGAVGEWDGLELPSLSDSPFCAASWLTTLSHLGCQVRRSSNSQAVTFLSNRVEQLFEAGVVAHAGEVWVPCHECLVLVAQIDS